MLQTRRSVAHLISAYDQPNELVMDLPNVTPGKYRIPGVCMKAEDIAALCQMSLRSIEDPAPEVVQYAEKSACGRYVVVTVFDAFSPVQSTATQKEDEFGQRMEPPIARMLRPIPASQIANQMERDFKHMGVFTIQSDTPTEADITRAIKAMRQYKLQLISETNKGFTRFGERAVSPQARRIAWGLHVAGELSPLPPWAVQNPDGDSTMTFNCVGCGALISKTSVKCQHCNAIYNWQKAVDLGLVRPGDVPPSKRTEAGLDPVQPLAAEVPTPEEVAAAHEVLVDSSVPAEPAVQV